MALFMEYLNNFEKRINEGPEKKTEKVIQAVAVKSKNPTRNSTQPIVETNKKMGGSSFSICTTCGTKQPVLLEGTFCPSCGNQSLIKSTGFQTRAQVKEKIVETKGTISHAESLLDDDTEAFSENYVSPLQKLIKAPREVSLEEGRKITDHASDLLGDDDGMLGSPNMPNLIPMPDFSSMMNKQKPVVENASVNIDPSLQIMSIPQIAVDPGIEAEMASLGLL